MHHRKKSARGGGKKEERDQTLCSFSVQPFGFSFSAEQDNSERREEEKKEETRLRFSLLSPPSLLSPLSRLLVTSQTVSTNFRESRRFFVFFCAPTLLPLIFLLSFHSLSALSPPLHQEERGERKEKEPRERKPASASQSRMDWALALLTSLLSPLLSRLVFRFSPFFHSKKKPTGCDANQFGGFIFHAHSSSTTTIVVRASFSGATRRHRNR